MMIADRSRSSYPVVLDGHSQDSVNTNGTAMKENGYTEWSGGDAAMRLLCCGRLRYTELRNQRQQPFLW